MHTILCVVLLPAGRGREARKRLLDECCERSVQRLPLHQLDSFDVSTPGHIRPRTKSPNFFKTRRYEKAVCGCRPIRGCRPTRNNRHNLYQVPLMVLLSARVSLSNFLPLSPTKAWPNPRHHISRLFERLGIVYCHPPARCNISLRSRPP